MFHKWMKVCATGALMFGAAELGMFPTQGMAASSSPLDLHTAASISTHGNGQLGSIIAQPSSDASMARDYIGKTVMNLGNKTIGSVQNLVISDTGKVQAAIVDVGKFIGKGKKDVAIAFRAIERVRDDKTGEYQLMLDADRTQLAAAPAFVGESQNVALLPAKNIHRKPASGKLRSDSPSAHYSIVPDAEAIVKTGVTL